MTRWKDTLPDASPSLVAAAHNLVLAKIYAGEWSRRPASAAAAHIRAYRKSLGVKSTRCDSLNEGMTDELLWSALESVAAAARAPDPHTKAVWCRYAEADLREMWKRRQA